jgi:hypothetical protein
VKANGVEAPGALLPASAGRLIGRAHELARIYDQLKDGNTRLLTLCGVGGIGKTRLALEVARTLQADFADGARRLWHQLQAERW